MASTTTPRYSDELYLGALAEVNRIRQDYSLGEPLEDLPKGYRANCSHCPIAEALHAEVTGRVILAEWCPPKVTVFDNEFAYGHHFMWLPLILREFIDAFDHSAWPELVA